MSDFDNKKQQDKEAKKHEFLYETGAFNDEDLLLVHSQLMREKIEPTERMAPIPLFLLGLFGMLLFWGGFYLARYSGGFSSTAFNPEIIGTAVAEKEKPFDPIARGKKLFIGLCQNCHQANGEGLPGVYPPLRGSPWLLTSDVRPIKILLKGLSGPINVHGHDFDLNMPNVADWKDRDIAAVLTFVRQNWDNKADPISEDLVKKTREEIKDRHKPWTGDEILAEHPLPH